MKNDFKDITIYIGMDIHIKSWKIEFLSDHSSLMLVCLSTPSCDSFIKLLILITPKRILYVRTKLGTAGSGFTMSLLKEALNV